MYWTKKHDEWCLKFGLSGSAKLLASWITRKTDGKTINEIEINLKDFNKWVAKKRGKEYDRKTLKYAIAKIFDNTRGWICEFKKISWFYFKVVVKPISFLNEKKSPEVGESPNPQNVDWSSQAEHKKQAVLQQQQNISNLDTMFRNLGLRYDANALNRIWALSGKCFDRIQQAIELMLYRHRNKEIPSPHGFIVQCLKENWQEGFNIYYEPELPKFFERMDIAKFVRGLLPKPATA